MQEIQIGKSLIGPRHPPFLVAELSANHAGSLSRALEIIEMVKKAGFHAVKLQTYTPDTITLNIKSEEFLIQEPESPWYKRYLYELYQEAYTPWEWHQPIFEYCRKLEMEVFSSPFDETAVIFSSL